ncbi:MAG TPA: hypothetical protein VD886_17030, partial [Herpetosiphonaceae bacterium]|nr:hypothetical protein [Herpetosiphonaceae bacterium]
MGKIWFIARRDILYHLGRRDFYWSTFGVPLLGIVIYLIARVLGGDPSGRATVTSIVGSAPPPGHTVGYIDQAGAILRHTEIVSPTRFQAFASLAEG